MAVAVANARQSVLAPARKARRFGLFSVADVVDGGESPWIMGGLVADGEQCSEPLEGPILCGPTANKTSRSWYSDLVGDPWLAYMFETCKTVGRFDESAAKLRTRFAASEEAAAEAGFQKYVLAPAYSWGLQTSVAHAIGKLEQEAGEVYGSQITLLLPFVVGQEAAAKGLLVRVGDHLETVTGSLVSIGNYSPALNGGTDTVPVLYATGSVLLHRSSLLESGPVLGKQTGTYNNDYFTLIERAYAGLVDCFMASATTPLCDCGP
jgi:hypothetical protein